MALKLRNSKISWEFPNEEMGTMSAEVVYEYREDSIVTQTVVLRQNDTILGSYTEILEEEDVSETQEASDG